MRAMDNCLSALIPKAEVAVIDGGDSLRQAVEKLNHYHYAEVPVLGSEGHYLYSISSSDILAFLQNRELTLREMEAVHLSEVPIYRPIVPLPINADEETVVKALLGQNYVPMVDEHGIFIGIITRKSFYYQKKG